MDLSRISTIGAVVALVCLALAAVLLVAPGDEAFQRLALVFGVIGLVIPSLLALLKSDQAASNTNGKLDARIEAGVHRAMAARRRGDEPATPAEIDAGTGYH